MGDEWAEIFKKKFKASGIMKSILGKCPMQIKMQKVNWKLRYKWTTHRILFIFLTF